MMKERRQVYVIANTQEHEFIYTGIDFYEFIKCLTNPIENLMIITGGSNAISLETQFDRGLELFDGYELVESLAKENIYNLGNFCFVDYASSNNTSDLSEDQIAELLYLGHMFKPLHTPFFEALQNRFAYLAHDDGFYCKLYSRSPLDFATVLCNKIKLKVQNLLNSNICDASDDVKEKIIQLTTEGLYIDFDELLFENDTVIVKLYIVGVYSNMDTICNNCKQIKLSASQLKKLTISKKEWIIS